MNQAPYGSGVPMSGAQMGTAQMAAGQMSGAQMGMMQQQQHQQRMMMQQHGGGGRAMYMGAMGGPGTGPGGMMPQGMAMGPGMTPQGMTQGTGANSQMMHPGMMYQAGGGAGAAGSRMSGMGGMPGPTGHMVPNPQQQQVMMQLNQLVQQYPVTRDFPPEMRMKLIMETGEKRRKMVQQCQQQLEMHRQQQQQMQQQQGGMRNGQMSYGGGAQIQSEWPPAASQSQQQAMAVGGMVQSQNMRMGPQGPVSIASSVSGMMPSQQQMVPPASLMHHSMSSPQVSQAGMMSGGSPAMIPGVAASPRPNTAATPLSQQQAPLSQQNVGSMHPSHPGPSSVQGGVGASPAAAAPASVESSQQLQQDADLKKLVTSLKERYSEQIRRIHDRCILDGMKIPRGFPGLMKIFDDHNVSFTVDKLERAIKGLEETIDTFNLSYPITSVLKKRWREGVDEQTVQDASYGRGKGIRAAEPPTLVDDSVEVGAVFDASAVDPWRSVRHLSIKVPDDVRSLVAKWEETTSKRRKRPAEIVTNCLAPPKSARFDFTDAAEPTPTPTAFASFNWGSTVRRRSTKRSNEEDAADMDEERTTKPLVAPRIELSCYLEESRKWQMSVEASTELQQLHWHLDPDYRPPTHRSPDALIFFQSHLMSTIRLYVLVPSNYPQTPPVVQFERSFPYDIPISHKISSMFERQLSLAVEGRTLTALHDAFRDAVEDFVRIKGIGHPNAAPCKQQKTITA